MHSNIAMNVKTFNDWNSFQEALNFLQRDHDLMLQDLWALENEQGEVQIFYHLYLFQTDSNLFFSLKASRVESMENFPAAFWPEREIYDLFGAAFKQQKRLFYPSSWTGHELCKSFTWPSEEEASRLRLEIVPLVQEEWKRKRSECDFVWGAEYPICRQGLMVSGSLCGEVVGSLEIEVGLLHWGIEKVVENRSWQEIMGYFHLLNPRLSLHWMLTYATLLEAAMQIKVPKKAEVLRMIFLEYERIYEHLSYLKSLMLFLLDSDLFSAIEKIQKILYPFFHQVVRDKSIYQMIEVGGFSIDVEHDWPMKGNQLLGQCAQAIQKLYRDFQHSLHGYVLGKRDGSLIIDSLDVLNFGLTGPIMRASGIAHDLRRQQGMYAQLDFEIPLGKEGSLLDHVLVRFEEILQSIHILQQLQENLPGGELFDVERHQRHVPSGSFYHQMESPNGLMGIALEVSEKNLNRPWRMHLRSPSLFLAQCAEKKLCGVPFIDLPLALAAFNIHPGEIDR